MPKNLMERKEHSLITDGVWEHEQTLQASRPFWVFFLTNLGIPTWLMGVLLAGMGLGFADAMFTLLIGGIIGSALPAATALIGPQSRLSQIEVSRLSLGKEGKKLPALFNWINCVGWDSVNNIMSSAALVTFFSAFGFAFPFWLALAVLVGTQLVIGVYGHHLIQKTSKYTGALQGILFVIIGIIAIHETDGTAPVAGHAAMKDIFSAIALIAALNLSIAFSSADYTRYLPKKTLKRSVFLAVFGGTLVPVLILGYFGYMTASVVAEQTPDGVMKALQSLTGHFAPFVLLLVAFNSIPANAVNDNSAAYSLMSSGFKLSRPASAIIGAIAGYFTSLFASNAFVDDFETLISYAADLVTPWAAILLVHWYVIHKTERRTASGVTIGFFIFAIVSALSIFLFSATSFYTGLASKLVGGVDVGPYIGFVLSGLAYYALFKFFPDRFKVVRSKKEK